jgi:hypothetical protein
LFSFTLFLIAICVAPAGAWVGTGGAYNGAAVGPRDGSVYGPNGGAVVARPYGGCCYQGYNGYNVAAPSVAATSGRATSAEYSVTKAAVPGTPFFVAPAPVGEKPAIGTILYSLPTGCISTFTNSTSYYQCGSAYYQAFYQAGTLVYQVVEAPY